MVGAYLVGRVQSGTIVSLRRVSALQIWLVQQMVLDDCRWKLIRLTFALFDQTYLRRLGNKVNVLVHSLGIHFHSRWNLPGHRRVEDQLWSRWFRVDSQWLHLLLLLALDIFHLVLQLQLLSCVVLLLQRNQIRLAQFDFSGLFLLIHVKFVFIKLDEEVLLIIFYDIIYFALDEGLL